MERTIAGIGIGVVGAYLAGSVNLTVIASRLLRLKGLRETGSGNPGVTNLYRIAGPAVAVPVLVLELLKAFAAFYGMKISAGDAPEGLWILPYLFGNLFPLFHGFRGGKGVAAAVGALLVAQWKAMLLGGAVFILVFLLFRRVSLGSLAMAVSWPLLIWRLDGIGPLFFVCCATATTLFVTHRANIRRLVSGNEPPLRRRGAS